MHWHTQRNVDSESGVHAILTIPTPSDDQNIPRLLPGKILSICFQHFHSPESDKFWALDCAVTKGTTSTGASWAITHLVTHLATGNHLPTFTSHPKLEEGLVKVG